LVDFKAERSATERELVKGGKMKPVAIISKYLIEDGRVRSPESLKRTFISCTTQAEKDDPRSLSDSPIPKGRCPRRCERRDAVC
jgi:hypothetical protein